MTVGIGADLENWEVLFLPFAFPLTLGFDEGRVGAVSTFPQCILI